MCICISTCTSFRLYFCLCHSFVSFCQSFFRSISWSVICKKSLNFTCMYLSEISVYSNVCKNCAFFFHVLGVAITYKPDKAVGPSFTLFLRKTLSCFHQIERVILLCFILMFSLIIG